MQYTELYSIISQYKKTFNSFDKFEKYFNEHNHYFPVFCVFEQFDAECLIVFTVL